jgi:hypothetical protein
MWKIGISQPPPIYVLFAPSSDIGDRISAARNDDDDEFDDEFDTRSRGSSHRSEVCAVAYFLLFFLFHHGNFVIAYPISIVSASLHRSVAHYIFLAHTFSLSYCFSILSTRSLFFSGL